VDHGPVVIAGGGAIGGITAAYLTRAGVDVTVLDTWSEHVRAMREGLRVTGVRGEFTQPLRAMEPGDLLSPVTPSPSTAPAPVRLVLLAVKSLHSLDALRPLVGLLGPESRVVSLQNSINEDLIAAEVGAERTIGCMIGWGATSVGPGHLEQTSLGEFVVGGLDGRTGGDVETVRDLLGLVTDSYATPNIYGFLWLKLIANCVIGVGTLLGRTVGETLAVPEVGPVVRAVIREGLDVAARLGITLETQGMALGPDQYPGMKDFICDALGARLAGEHAGILPGPYQDILKGRKTEVDYINGYVAARGRELGVPAPVNAAVVGLVHEIEEGRRRPGLHNVVEVAAGIREGTA